MKAKHFKKLRTKSQYYLVLETSGLFGNFKGMCSYSDAPLSDYTTVLARSSFEACNRLAKRNHSKKRSYSDNLYECKKIFAIFKVYPLNKPYERFVKYYN